MEVHHHSHHNPKKWSSYLWEFLMLFLAVFCGFLAENIREHSVEHQRAKQLARNLYKEIIADSITVQERISTRNRKEAECEHFINYVKDSDLVHLSKGFYPAFSWALIQTQKLMFDPNDGILNQLRNSGELRYFKDPELQAAVGRLTVVIANIRTRNDKEYSFVEMYLRPFTMKYYDFEWYESLTEHGKYELLTGLLKNSDIIPPGKIINLDQFKRQEGINICSYYLLMLRATRMAQYMSYAAINHELLEILRKDFHLK